MATITDLVNAGPDIVRGIVKIKEMFPSSTSTLTASVNTKNPPLEVPVTVVSTAPPVDVFKRNRVWG
jgi:hypothetical protein